MNKPNVILSGFADEAANDKLAVQQFAALAAAGLQYYSIRFIDVGTGVKNSMDLTKQELKQVVQMQKEYGLSVATVGSPIGKVKLLDVNDGSSNRFIPFKQYLAKNVRHACEVANSLGTKLIRGFSFYHPIGTDPLDHLHQTCDQLGLYPTSVPKRVGVWTRGKSQPCWPEREDPGRDLSPGETVQFGINFRRSQFGMSGNDSRPGVC